MSMASSVRVGEPAYAAIDLTLRAGARTLLGGFTQTFRPGEIW